MVSINTTRVKFKKAWRVLPWRGVSRCKLVSCGWLLCPDGNLKEIFNGLQEPVMFIPGCAGTVEQSFAGGLRPGGAGRLTGVLHYYTRGPD